MKWFIIIAMLLTRPVWARPSKVIPVFLEAVDIYLEYHDGPPHILRPELQKIISLLKEKQISEDLLRRYLEVSYRKSNWQLPADDSFDAWRKEPRTADSDVPEIALHAFKMDVVEESDDWLDDDIYVFYFMTDGVIPTGKVTTIYKGLDQNSSFFFNEIDRAIYPLMGVPAKKPENHLIIDYGIIESDGDDIKDLQKLSSIIIDIAIAVYTSYDPQNAEILINLRKEIKALTEMLLAMNNDDRLVTSTFGFKTQEITELLKNETFVEFKKNHKKTSTFDNWEYNLHFRLLRK